MRIGLVELLLILLIAALSIGPSAALWVERWMRRAQRSTAAAARRRAAQEAQRAAEREEVLQRFQKLSIVFVFCAAAALVWGLVLRPIDVTVTPYTAPEVQPMPDAGPPPKAATSFPSPAGGIFPASGSGMAGSTSPHRPTPAPAGPRCCGCGRTAAAFLPS